ncbi:MAG: GNAT family N-acetyltransferase [Candidatus Saccharicenans sp.]|jgi:GNAT superfamily N-acetyltransferase|nr:GNAT family N-acetyltransferase [Candidatus Saccharicenans sp.]MDH7574975.1 GNAT family N-acetyltransferase [Candidatus Saccharicenans sp.]
MSINLIEVKTKPQLKTFIYLPEKLHQDQPNWVHPIYMDEWAYFNPKKNKAFSYSDTLMLLAEKDGQVVGRVMGIINHRYNEVRNEKTARFGYLESIQDQAVVHALLSRVEQWAREKGMTRIIGPYGFSDQDPEGFLIKGFENRATIATYYNFEWLPEMVEKEGYSKDIDYFVYKIEVPKEIPEIYTKIAERILKKGNFKILEFRKRKEIKPWIRPILSLMNETYVESNIYGYAPLDEKEMDDLARKYLPVLDPRFIKGVLKDGQVVAFIVAIPDMTAGIKKARGRLFPFGFIHVLRAQKKTKQLDLLLGAIKKEYRGMGLDALMGVALLSSAQKAGFEIMDTHHEMEANVRVRSEMERLGGKIYKVYRVYQKALV